MTRLREALGDIAAEAPLVNLAEAAIAGHRRRRRATVALAAVTTAVVVGVTGLAVTLPERLRAGQATVPASGAEVPDLPEGGVGKLSHAYQTPCEWDPATKQCTEAEWRVVTAAGRTYRLPRATVATRDPRVPVAISRDGRMLAYHSAEAQAHIVRDMVTGTEVTSPVTVREEDIQGGSMLVISDDGRYLVFDPKEGSKYPGVLIDTRTGKRTTINGKYEAVAIKDGIVELVRYVKTDLWLMPVKGGGKPVRFDGTFIMFSEVAPDGRTVVAWEHPGRKKVRRPELTVLDAKTGRTVRKVAIRGLPAARQSLDNTGVWRSAREVTVKVGGKMGAATYGVDIATGKARLLAEYDDDIGPMTLTLPGNAGGVY
ncbi:hypothetical protein AB0I81_23875 [Nonomuraea sp. NPDC050404]|uniref:hypothetical protein n=1 Tax=Nonomuraea sp. NPDC050404 TaxID=3155783 RepID=UPI0033DE847F